MVALHVSDIIDTHNSNCSSSILLNKIMALRNCCSWASNLRLMCFGVLLFFPPFIYGAYFFLQSWWKLKCGHFSVMCWIFLKIDDQMCIWSWMAIKSRNKTTNVSVWSAMWKLKCHHPMQCQLHYFDQAITTPLDWKRNYSIFN